MIDDGMNVGEGARDRVFALVFVDNGRSEVHGIYSSIERASRVFVSLATAGLIDPTGCSYAVEEYPLDQPLLGAEVVTEAELFALLDGKVLLPEE